MTRRASRRRRPARGVEEGSVAPAIDPESATAALLGTIFYRRRMINRPFDPGEASDLVETVLGSPPRRRGRR